MDTFTKRFIDMTTLEQRLKELRKAKKDTPKKNIRLIHALSEDQSELLISDLLRKLKTWAEKTTAINKILQNVESPRVPYFPMTKKQSEKAAEKAAENREVFGILS